MGVLQMEGDIQGAEAGEIGPKWTAETGKYKKPLQKPNKSRPRQVDFLFRKTWRKLQYVMR